MILDAAEALFAQRGFDGVSVRMVADEAKAGLGLVTHHFPAKDILFAEVIGRRSDRLNDARRDALAKVGPGADLESLLRAFVEPYRDLIETGDPGWRSYARLHAIVTQDARWTALLSQYFSEMGREMMRRIRAAEPGLDEDMAVRAYVHLVSVMIGMFASTGLLDRFSDGRLRSDDIGANLEPMIRFAAAGIRSLGKTQA